jgi:hypothetical protein
MPAKRLDALPLVSNAHRYVVTVCPNCGRDDTIRGPFDTRVMATFLFTRTYCCLKCWWNRELEMKDDVAEAAKKHQRAEEKKHKQREQARRT